MYHVLYDVLFPNLYRAMAYGIHNCIIVLFDLRPCGGHHDHCIHVSCIIHYSFMKSRPTCLPESPAPRKILRQQLHLRQHRLRANSDFGFGFQPGHGHLSGCDAGSESGLCICSVSVICCRMDNQQVIRS